MKYDTHKITIYRCDDRDFESLEKVENYLVDKMGYLIDKVNQMLPIQRQVAPSQKLAMMDIILKNRKELRDILIAMDFETVED